MPDNTELERPRDVAASGLTATKPHETRDDGRVREPSTPNELMRTGERLTALEATIDQYKHAGVPDGQGNARPWQDFPEEEKFDRIMAAMRELRVENEPAAYYVLGREVDMAHLPEAPAAAPDARDGLPMPREWQKLQAEWTHDSGLRRLDEHAVRYEELPGRPAPDPAHRARFQQRDDAKGLDR